VGGDSGKGAGLQNLDDLSKITVHNFGAQGCVLFSFNCERLFYAGEHVLLLESSSLPRGCRSFQNSLTK